MAPGAPSSTSVPWWAHVLIGIAVGALGAIFYAFGDHMFGEGLVISSVAFLGVGSGVAANS